ncbi:phospholipase A1 1-like [Macrosteles quadrilineatus]|uniref:phospholipase A1 1-like n=1 Tax=Macrosteles quadrilineatus TaxID=74068 RepID=UPI0023E09B2F|nr:phospholipase A1 1-like [Macrosteles quadrilineatus]
MKPILLFLIFVNLQGSNGDAYKWRNFLPTTKSLPKGEIGSKISLRLVDKQWMPDGTEGIQNDDVIPRYRGKVKDALKMFMSEDLEVKYHKSELEKAKDLLKEENGYKKDQDSIFLIHTVSGSAKDNFIKNSVIALALRNFLKKYNVFAFHMKELQDYMEQSVVKAMYGQRANYDDLSETIGGFFNSVIGDNLMDIDRIHLVGFCFSAQLAGYISRYVSSKNGGKKIKSITALDPYSSFLFGIKNKVISKHDAELVFVYHTNSLFAGSMYRKATADFTINNGWFQPGCSYSTNILCSHRRSVTLFWYVILYPELWTARKCSSYLMFSSCFCSFAEKTSLVFPPAPGARGTYYLNTMKHKPYGFGPAGANCITFFRKKKANDIVNKISN